jgi:hypothetical protein
MFASAGFSFILYLLVFFRLRGNISLSTGYKIHFHQRPKLRVGRTHNGTYVMTDDRRVESHLTVVAKQMLWYPIAYTVLVLPIAAARFSTFAGVLVPFPVTIFTAAVFMLSGFVNAVLFCITRNVLPGTWKQRFGIGTTLHSRQSTTALSGRTNPTWRGAESSARAGAGTIPTALTIGVENEIKIKYDDAESSPSFLKLGSPTPPASPLRAHGGGGQWSENYNHRIHPFPFPSPRDATKNIRIETDAEDDNGYPSAGVHPASKPKTVEWEVPQHRGQASSRHGSRVYGRAPGLEAPASIHPLATNQQPPQTQHGSLAVDGRP